MHSHLPVFIGASGPMAKVWTACVRLARTPHPLLIVGAPGTGKTVLARELHRESRRPGAFIRQSTAGIPPELVQSELGGHARGAFTGADHDRMGLLEAAQKGTFFLDELGIAPPKCRRCCSTCWTRAWCAGSAKCARGRSTCASSLPPTPISTR